MNANRCPLCGNGNADRFAMFFDGALKLYRCRVCGFVAQYPGPGIVSVGTDYEGFYDDPEQDSPTSGDTWVYSYRTAALRDIATRIRQYTGAGARLLDVGTGDGHFVAACVDQGLDAYGIEPSVAMTDFAERKLPGRVTRGFYCEEAYPPESFDAISFIQVVEHLEQPGALLAAAQRHLRPGGILAIEVPSLNAPHFLAYRVTGLKRFVQPPDGVIRTHVGYYSPATMRRLTTQAGFVEVATVTGRWSVKYKGLKQRLGRVLDPLANALGVGGILYLGRKVG